VCLPSACWPGGLIVRAGADHWNGLLESRSAGLAGNPGTEPVKNWIGVLGLVFFHAVRSDANARFLLISAANTDPNRIGASLVESAGEVKEHDSHRASGLLHVRKSSMQGEDDGVVHPNAKLVGKLQPVH